MDTILLVLSVCTFVSSASVPLFGLEDGFGSEGAFSLPPTQIIAFGSATIDIDIVFQQAMSTVPIVLSAVRSLSWTNELGFKFSVISISQTGFTLQLTDVKPGLSLIEFSHAYYDSTKYNRQQQTFTFTDSFTVAPYAQHIEVTNYEQYYIPILMGYSDKLMPQFVNLGDDDPQVITAVRIPAQILTNYMNITVEGDNGYYIQYLEMSLNNLTSMIVSLSSPRPYYTEQGFISLSSYYYSWNTMLNLQSMQNSNVFFGITMVQAVVTKDMTANLVMQISQQAQAQMICFLIAFTVTGCNETYPLYYFGSCYDICPDGFYGDQFTDYKCQRCLSPCDSCSNSLYNCTTCLEGRIALINETANLWSCICGPQEYGAPDTPGCTLCSSSIPNCKYCQSGSFCDECHISFQYNAGTNVCECKVGYSQTINSRNGQKRCVRETVSQSCENNGVIDSGGLSCICPAGTNLKNGECI